VDEARVKLEKSLSAQELYDNFDDYKLGGYKECLSSFLMNRGVPYNFIQSNQARIAQVFKDVGYYDRFYTTELPIHKDNETNVWMTSDGKPANESSKEVKVLLIPSYDGSDEKNLIGMKIRRVDGKNIRGKKSLCPYGLKTGIFYDTIDEKSMTITEGETDYFILAILGFN